MVGSIGMKSPHVDVSVVVPTFNSARVLGDLIDSLSNQEGVVFEVFFVDNDSRDTTRQLVVQGGFDYVNFPGNRSAAREHGTEMARGDYVFFVDSDQILALNCLSILCQVARTSDCDAIVVEETALGRGRWFNLLRTEDRVETALGLGLPRWFKKSVIAPYRVTTKLHGPHIHGEDRLLKRWLESRGSQIQTALGPLLFHKDPPLQEYLSKQFVYAFLGTQEKDGKAYLKATLPSLGHLLKINRVRSATGSIRSSATYYWLVSVKVMISLAGMAAARLTIHHHRSSPSINPTDGSR